MKKYERERCYSYYFFNKNVYVKEHISMHEVKDRASYNVTNMMQIELCPLMCICHYCMYSLFDLFYIKNKILLLSNPVLSPELWGNWQHKKYVGIQNMRCLSPTATISIFRHIKYKIWYDYMPLFILDLIFSVAAFNFKRIK